MRRSRETTAVPPLPDERDRSAALLRPSGFLGSTSLKLESSNETKLDGARLGRWLVDRPLEKSHFDHTITADHNSDKTINVF